MVGNLESIDGRICWNKEQRAENDCDESGLAFNFVHQEDCDNGIKENLNNGTNIYRFYDLKNKYVYYADNSSMPGEFSGGVIK